MNLSTFRQRLIREPLAHFVVFGAVVFGLDALIESRREDPKVISVGAAVDKEARDIFRAGMGREPSAREMQILRERHIDNEVLYREGLALRVDQGDRTIRERVIFKALNVMQANLVVPKIDEAGLRAWFEKNQANYDEPARFDFLEAVLSGDASPEVAEKFVTALNSGAQSDTQSGLRVFKERPRSNLVTSYGDEFTAALEQMPVGQWRALQSKEGLRVVRLEARRAGQTANYENIQGRVYDDWKDATMQALRTGAVRELGKKYTVRTGEEVQ
jgi:hypothetical protein